tara:strand:- start:527 stop:1228 length:702 start_codon:yes stop_codon:yes gene_type:complete
MKKFETKKLFYDTYLYKVQIGTCLAARFRTALSPNKKLGQIKEVLRLADKGETVSIFVSSYQKKHLSKYDIKLCRILYNILMKYDNYIIRCENNLLSVYTNDYKLLEQMSKIDPELLDTTYIELWQPQLDKINLLLSNKNIILSNDEIIPYPYKITFGSKKQTTSHLLKWIKNHKDKVKIGNIFLKMLDSNSTAWIKGYYIYVSDEKLVLLLQMLIGNNIQRIDKLVSTADNR